MIHALQMQCQKSVDRMEYIRATVASVSIICVGGTNGAERIIYQICMSDTDCTIKSISIICAGETNGAERIIYHICMRGTDRTIKSISIIIMLVQSQTVDCSVMIVCHIIDEFATWTVFVCYMPTGQ